MINPNDLARALDALGNALVELPITNVDGRDTGADLAAHQRQDGRQTVQWAGTTIDPTTLTWRMSSHRDDIGGTGVQVAELPDGGRAVRNMTDHDTTSTLWFTAAEWSAFVQGARAGEFD